MYHSWLDHWDERRARRGEEGKKSTDFALDAERAFPGAKKITSIEEFCALADQAVADPAFFDDPNVSDQGFERLDGWLKFPSDISTDIEQNNVVSAKITESGSFDQAMVIFHHWNATFRNCQIANFFSQRGITVVEIAMPYHFERSRPGSAHADYMLSPNLGRTIQSVRQAVLDGRKLIAGAFPAWYKRRQLFWHQIGRPVLIEVRSRLAAKRLSEPPGPGYRCTKVPRRSGFPRAAFPVPGGHARP